MTLNTYNKKRNFNNTNEPEGKTNKKSNKKLIYVIQYHEATAKHYDFRLEWKGVLISFAVPKGLSTNKKDKRLAVKVEDHPYEYKDFEGIIPKGNYGAGTVSIFDKGFYTPLDDLDKGLKNGHLKILLDGEKYKGIWSLVKLDEKNWLIINQENKNNVKLVENNNKLPFKNCEVNLATLTDKIPAGDNYLFEIKYDGFRAVSYMEKSKTKILTRNGLDYTTKFSSIAKSLNSMCAKISVILDGEIVVFDAEGKSNFSLMQSCIKNGKQNFTYVVFDILALNSQDLRNKPLLERKEILKNFLYKCPNNILFSEYSIGKGKQCYNIAKKLSLEGIIAKKVDSFYKGTRSEDWLKIKNYKRQEFVIGGFCTSDKTQYFSSLLLGYYKKDKLIFIGKVGTGFSDEIKEKLYKSFKNLQTEKSPFYENLKEKNVIYLTPKLVAEIQFTEITKDNLLRQASFIGIRQDKKSIDVTLEYKK